MPHDLKNQTSVTFMIDSKNIIDNPNSSCSSSFAHDVHKSIRYTAWPLWDEQVNPSLIPGSNLTKPLNLALKEYEWNSIEHHTKTLGVRKIEWVRYAIFRLMQKEQLQLQLQFHANSSKE